MYVKNGGLLDFGENRRSMKRFKMHLICFLMSIIVMGSNMGSAYYVYAGELGTNHAPEIENESEYVTAPEIESEPEQVTEPKIESEPEQEPTTEIATEQEPTTEIVAETEPTTEIATELDIVTETYTEYEELEPAQVDGIVDDCAAVCDGEYDSDLKLEALDNNVAMTFKGSYYTEEASKILKRLNEIRYEACREGYKDPYTQRKLTLADYKPLRWSSDMEEICRIRAAEASIHMMHDRPNGAKCFTATSSRGEQSWHENLAWNWDGLMAGIEQWYKEKDKYIAGGYSFSVTGHYEGIISTKHNYVAVACYKPDIGDSWYCIAQEFSYKTGLNETKDNFAGSRDVNIEIANSKISSVQVVGLPKYVEQGKKGRLTANGTASLYYYGRGNVARSGRLVTAPWVSDNSNILRVDAEGNWSSAAVGSPYVGYVNVSVSAGARTASAKTYVYDPADSPIAIQRPQKTVYLVNEPVNYSGGYAVNIVTNAKYALNANNTKGFDSKATGLKTLTVTVDGLTKTFNILVIEAPEINTTYGKTYADVVMPENEYGVFIPDSNFDKTQAVGDVGSKTIMCTFRPKPAYSGILTERTSIKVTLKVYRALTSGVQVVFLDDSVSYMGVPLSPSIKLICDGVTLKEGVDYTLAFSNNTNVGTGNVTVRGAGFYTGVISGKFSIEPATVVIKADDKRLLTGNSLPNYNYYTYTVSGLFGNDTLLTKPSLRCNVTNMQRSGKYDIICSGARATGNYRIEYVNGQLIVAGENASYEVEFKMNNHGTVNNSQEYVAILSGSLVPVPDVTSNAGYRLEGWYTDETLKTPWNFDKDVIKSDMTLYAAWARVGGANFSIRSIEDCQYTGSVIKPVVSVYDGDMLLKQGKDYTLTYANGINVNEGGRYTTDIGSDGNYDSSLPYVTVTGKGNYSGSLTQNYNIVPQSIGSGEPAAGITLKIFDQLTVNTKKEQKTFSLIKSKKGMVIDRDYTISLKTVRAYDADGNQVASGMVMPGAMVPARYSGSYILTITGIGNYSGNIIRNIYVNEKQYLISNAIITLGKNMKTREFDGSRQELVPGYYDASSKAYYVVNNGIIGNQKVNATDIYTVKSGSNYLVYGVDYLTEYSENTAVGTATLTIVGKGRYQGRKSITFKITGRAFNTANVTVDNLKDLEYTGSTLTQNDVAVYWKKGTSEQKRLVYGTDYYVTYVNNIAKGTATVTFIGNSEAGYTGQFVKRFKITAADINNRSKVAKASSMNNIVVAYEKAGVKPFDEVVLTSVTGKRLVKGTDYTVTCKNNKKVVTVGASTPENELPTMTITGKGNYTGTMYVSFSIVKKELTDASITVEVSPIVYSANRNAKYEYKPQVKVKDGNAVLGPKDYEIIYSNNTQSDVAAYMENVAKGSIPMSAPKITITANVSGNYVSAHPIELTIPIFGARLNSANTIVIAKDATYTGSQCRPTVAVYYSDNPNVVKEAKTYTTEKEILAAGMKKLNAARDYTVTYGTNINVGINKGIVTVRGQSPYYGGSVNGKFSISAKGILW